MPAYNFKAMFAEAVESGRKRCTIRKRRKRPTKVGETLYIYTGMRTKECRKLREAECLAVVPVRIDEREFVVNGHELKPGTADAIARLDTAGIWGWRGFVQFFADTYGLPFEGVLIQWLPHDLLNRFTGVEDEDGNEVA